MQSCCCWKQSTLVMHKTPRLPQGAPLHHHHPQQCRSHHSVHLPQTAPTHVLFSPTTSQRSKFHPTPIEDAVLHQIVKAKDNQREEYRHFGTMVADMLAKRPAHEHVEAQLEIYQLIYQKQKKVFEHDFSQ